MRGTVGLVGLLLTLGLVLMIFKYFEAPTLEKGKEAQDQVQQISGRGQDGKSVMDSFKMEPQLQNGRLNSLLVTEVTPGGAVDDYYGMKKGDRITFITNQAGLTKIGDASNDDPELAKIQVQQAFQGSLPIVVTRGGNSLTLPAPAAAQVVPGAAPAPTAGVAPQQSAPSPAPAQPAAPRNVYDQANGIKNALQGQ